MYNCCILSNSGKDVRNQGSSEPGCEHVSIRRVEVYGVITDRANKTVNTQIGLVHWWEGEITRTLIFDPCSYWRCSIDSG